MDKEQQKQLETVYERGLAAEKRGDFAQAAEAYRQMLALDAEDCAGASVRLASIGHGLPPKTAPKAYIATLFDQHADVFDMILVDKLGYDVPNLLFEEISKRYQPDRFKQMLDLGCGTGLVGEAFADFPAQKTGLDLSENMIEIAAEREIYDSLYVGDAVQFLRETAEHMRRDLIIAADVLPYIGDLREFFSYAGAALTEGGVFAFSSESLEKAERVKPQRNADNENGAAQAAEDYLVGAHQRFAHSAAYIAEILASAGLKIISATDIIVRREQDSPVYGQMIISEKA